MAQWINQTGRQPEQVQDFYPTPGTLSTCMYYTGLDPRTLEPVYIPKSAHEKAMQRALMQWRKPQNRKLVLEALHRTGREDLIGYGRECLLRPDRPADGRRPAGGGASQGPKKGSRPAGQKKTAARQAACARPAAPVRKAGWAKPKPKKNARPRKGGG